MRSDKTILVCDDHVHIRRAIELKLKVAGYRVLTARDGWEGLAIINEHRPDAVITDINMPEVDGRQLCERTRELKAESPFLTVVVTARIVPHEQDWIDQMQDTILMEKPFSPSRLLEEIDSYLGIANEQ